MAAAFVTDATTRSLALGIVAVPADATMRARIRETWLRDSAFVDGRAAGRFVVGAAATCARAAVNAEHRLHGDIAFVNTSDCHPWHAGQKVHAWYKYALRHLPARWYGKAEDDCIVNVATRR